ncbi:phosphoribosyl transferase [Rhypophila sp. PSN 637]
MLLDNDEQLPGDGLVVVFHREGIHFDGLVCHRTALFPTGTVSVSNECANVDSFVQFVSGCTVEGHGDVAKVTAEGNRASLCRSLGRSEGNFLIFSAPEVMLAFTRHAASIPELISQMPSLAAALMVPTQISHIQACVPWANQNRAELTVIGGSSHCIVLNIVAIDMCSFNNVHVAPTAAGVSLIIAEAGANSGDIIIKGMTEGLTVPLGSRPSVGAGLWLQGGIGHLVRMYGLTCDSVVGAVLVSADSGDIVYVGSPRADLERDILWAIKGAGTNFGVVVSVVFRSCPVSTFLLRSWKCPLFNDAETMHRVRRFDKEIARKLLRKCSSDAYLYHDTDTDKLHLGQFSSRIKGVLGLAAETRVVDCNGLFETDMYMSGMQHGHGGSKTSSFKRCVFLKDIGSADTTLQAMVNAMNMRPTPLCYLHLLHGDGSEGVVHNVRSEATAFGCRDWDFACVVTGVWLRDHNGSDELRQVQQWVYDIVINLLTLDSCSGVYLADLGLDPRDASLVLKAFGPNRLCLARLKKTLDLYNTIVYACLLPKEPKALELIILDYCADLWTSFFHIEQKSLTTRLVSISTAIKREYVEASGANLKRLLTEREYNEEYRLTLTAFWEKRVRERQNLAEETFLNCVYNAAVDDVDALVANVSYLVLNSRVVEVHVRADNETMRQRRSMMPPASSEDSFDAAPNTLNYIPDFIFENHASGDINVKNFAARYLVPYSGKRDDLRRLESMICCVPNFLRHGVDFRHVLGISQQLGGIPLADIDAIGVDIPLVIIRKARKLPPPVVLVAKGQSNISHVSSESTDEEWVEMERHAIPAPEGASVLVVDDMLASGRTLYAVLSLLREVGVEAGRISVIVVAEFPEVGFGQVRVQSLLVFGGV